MWCYAATTPSMYILKRMRVCLIRFCVIRIVPIMISLNTLYQIVSLWKILLSLLCLRKSILRLKNKLCKKLSSYICDGNSLY